MCLFTCWGALSVWQPFNSTRPGSQVPSFGRSRILLGAMITIHALTALLWRGIEESKEGCREPESALAILAPQRAHGGFEEAPWIARPPSSKYTAAQLLLNICKIVINDVKLLHKLTYLIYFPTIVLFIYFYIFTFFFKCTTYWLRYDWSTFNDFQRKRTA